MCRCQGSRARRMGWGWGQVLQLIMGFFQVRVEDGRKGSVHVGTEGGAEMGRVMLHCTLDFLASFLLSEAKHVVLSQMPA